MLHIVSQDMVNRGGGYGAVLVHALDDLQTLVHPVGAIVSPDRCVEDVGICLPPGRCGAVSYQRWCPYLRKCAWAVESHAVAC
ncbi:hypothetical protein BAUCODRAFT_245919 [Baudoinia panamericana UAMH 10762]|uniref:Uncharacterized protein n=1 Tax=Baudoinia panamericana (strain UAMH 10762) TaxID=717646 RepID=M2MAT8_BAUPA|nr:uncharacterized protein BAUCODRAFT_245919 [Baudoinia panamericana UAMH 10762]EMC93576.1 hypothetical protein BAUCODRAFT_245919 [Baudoinia panamericana UAMH 10762]